MTRWYANLYLNITTALYRECGIMKCVSCCMVLAPMPARYLIWYPAKSGSGQIPKKLNPIHPCTTVMMVMMMMMPNNVDDADGFSVVSHVTVMWRQVGDACARFCHDYDLCSACEKRGADVHDPSHVLLKMSVPCNKVRLSRACVESVLRRCITESPRYLVMIISLF